jgi:hypothetical protein
MNNIRKPNGELRAYILWNGRWCHVYIISGYDQMQLVGDPVKMLEFKLSKKSKETLAAEKIKFHKRKPSAHKPAGNGLA